MTSLATARLSPGIADLARWRAPAALLIGLVAVVAVRWAATRAGLDPLAVGAGFGILLVALALGLRGRARTWPAVSRPSIGNIAIGSAVGLVLVVLAIGGAALAGTTFIPGLGRPATALVPWALVTVLVASGEEALLRGRLFDAVHRAGGLLAAVVLTSVAFALLHVPLYGWGVVPLDLAVGVVFAGLRLLTHGVAAPAAAHAVADLATWWL